MGLVSSFLISLVAAQHVAFGVLEMFYWSKPLGRKVFGLSEKKAQDSAALAANQGLYNYFLAVGLGLSFFLPLEPAHWMQIFILNCVVVAGVFGALTVARKIFWVQSMPAVLALLSLLFK